KAREIMMDLEEYEAVFCNSGTSRRAPRSAVAAYESAGNDDEEDDEEYEYEYEDDGDEYEEESEYEEVESAAH
ncbi:MAG: hypothetical protein JXA52_08690, partial [Planctomycetes bacterium]|nr:hypothetical protein [Planctomycetota bacterium]